MRALCIHDIKGLSEEDVRKIIEKASGREDPKLLNVYYNLDRGEAFFEWETASIERIGNLHREIKIGEKCKELTLVTEVKVA